MQEINTLLEKYNNFKGTQIRSVINITEDSKVITLSEQDEDEQDIYVVKLTFTGIESSKILNRDTLGYLDTFSGITLIQENGLYGFAVGSCTSMSNIRNSPMYMVASGVKID
jgi:hypothetical protein